MRDNERDVGRADHNLQGARESTNGEESSTVDRADDSADRKAHGAHGRGGSKEERVDETPSEPGFSRGSDRGGSAGWGSEASGDSVIDKRPNP
jgi:hypothetical protein